MKTLAIFILLLLYPIACLAEPLDIDGDGKDDFVVVRRGVFLIYPAARLSDPSVDTISISCGQPDDIPVPGRWVSSSKMTVAAFNTSFRLWQICSTTSSESFEFFGDRNGRPVIGDYDGDGLTDFAVRTSGGRWYIDFNPNGANAGNEQRTDYGAEPSDLHSQADYDGDGITDFGLVRRNRSDEQLNFLHLPSTGGGSVETLVGQRGDIPVQGDYDGDGKDDLAVWQPITGTWKYIPSTGGGTVTQQWGLWFDIPAPMDVDGDGKLDFVVFRPGTGEWFVRPSGGGSTFSVQWGLPGDKLANDPRLVETDKRALIDFDGDRQSDLVVIRKLSSGSLQFLFSTGTSQPHPLGTLTFGQVGDVVLPGDYDGDMISDLATIRLEGASLVWRFRLSTFDFSSSSEIVFPFGGAGDLIVSGSFDGDRKTDYAIVKTKPAGILDWFYSRSDLNRDSTTRIGFRGDFPALINLTGGGGGTPTVIRSQNGELVWWSGTGSSAQTRRFGLAGQAITYGDYNGDGKEQIGTVADAGGAKLITIDGETPFFWGLAGDRTFAANYQGSRKLRRAAWRVEANGTATFYIQDINGNILPITWGAAGDVPLNPRGITFP